MLNKRKAVSREEAEDSHFITAENPPVLGRRAHVRLGFSLFWRTFLLLFALLVCSVLAWMQTLRALGDEPRIDRHARHIASIAMMTQAAFEDGGSTDTHERLVQTLARKEGLTVTRREASDRFVPLDRVANDDTGFSSELSRLLPSDALLVMDVNGVPGVYMGLDSGKEHFWMLLGTEERAWTEQTWISWLLIAAVLSLAGAALISSLINRPLKQLSDAATNVRKNVFAMSHLDEEVATSEIREVNIGFNRMTEKLAKMEQDRAIMLAGISHDLRTPLARLRLETEMSVADAEAREHMVADIAQLDAIIDKFMDYARPAGLSGLSAVNLRGVLENCIYAMRESDDVVISLECAEDLFVLADEVELGRIFSNLIENAHRYGKTPGTGIARIRIRARVHEDNMVGLYVRDYGMGVTAETLQNLTKPFFRGNEARTEVTGAGLGMSIVERNIHRMGGGFRYGNASSGGFVANIKLRRASREPSAGNSMDGKNTQPAPQSR